MVRDNRVTISTQEQVLIKSVMPRSLLPALLIENRYVLGGFPTLGWQNCPFQENSCSTGSIDYVLHDVQT